MTDSTYSPSDYQPVSDLLASLRRRIRSFVLIEAVLMALVLLGVVFWGGLLLDWMFEPPPRVRLLAHGLLIAALAVIIVWWGVRRWMVTLSDRSLALLIERKYPDLSDALSAAVDIYATRGDAESVHPELARRTLQSAASRAKGIDTDGLLNEVRLHRFALAVAGLAISVVAFAVALPSAWSTYTERIALSADRWPRVVSLSVEGFEPDGQGGYVRKVARNSDVPIIVHAGLTGGLEAPDRVSIRYRWQEGRRGNDDLVRIGDALSGRDESQRYEYLFERIAGDVEFDIRGGDDRVEHLRLKVVERPKVTDLAFECEYPEYLERSPRQIAVGPRVELPEGTRVKVSGKANKPLEVVRWRRITHEDDVPIRTEAKSVDFATDIQLAQSDVELEIELVDVDGIASAEPFRVTIAMRRDQKPQVAASRDGIGTSVTANAIVPVEVSIEDDHAVRSAWIDISRDGELLPKLAMGVPAGLRRDVVALATVDLGELAAANQDDPRYAFAPGQQLSLVATADDKYDLRDESRTAAARPLSFEIVTEAELMARLASGEQNLRQTFESVADKLLLLYDSLEKMEIARDDSRTTGMEGGDADLLVMETQQKSTTDDDQDRQTRESSRLAETARQIGDEVLGVAAGFEDIHAQLQNNRIDNSELFDRIGNRIAAPLRRLGEARMQAVAAQIAGMATSRSDTTSAKNETRQAIAEVEQLLREMQGLENYNEVIAMLRGIIRQQQQINARTKDEQKSELRDLLLD